MIVLGACVRQDDLTAFNVRKRTLNAVKSLSAITRVGGDIFYTLIHQKYSNRLILQGCASVAFES